MKIGKKILAVWFSLGALLIAISIAFIYNFIKPRPFQEFQTTGIAYAIQFSPDDSLVAVGGEGGFLQLWNVQGASLHTNLKGHSRSVFSLAFNSDGTLLASGSVDGQIIVWDVSKEQQATENTTLLISLHNFEIPNIDTNSQSLPSSPVFSLQFSPDGSRLAASSTNGRITIIDLESGVIQFSLQGHQLFHRYQQVYSVAFVTHGTMLASAGDDGTVHLWDVSTGKLAFVLNSPRTNVSIIRIAVRANTNLLSVIRTSSALEVWDLDRRVLLESRHLTENNISSAALSLDNSQVVMNFGRTPTEYEGVPLIGLHDPRFLFVNLTDQTSRTGLTTGSGYNYSFAFSTDGFIFASGSEDGFVRLWQVQDF